MAPGPRSPLSVMYPCPAVRRRVAACRDIAPELERLKLKAVARCRDHLMDRIYDMRRPKTNLQARRLLLSFCLWHQQQAACILLQHTRSRAGAWLLRAWQRVLTRPPAPLLPISQIKQSALLKYRYLAAFLRQHAPDLYAEVGRQF